MSCEHEISSCKCDIICNKHRIITSEHAYIGIKQVGSTSIYLQNYNTK